MEASSSGLVDEACVVNNDADVDVVNAFVDADVDADDCADCDTGCIDDDIVVDASPVCGCCLRGIKPTRGICGCG